jgi:predicted nucleic acid-binding protein
VILLDTGVVSAVLRRRRRGALEERVVDTVGSLLESRESVALPGIVFQEVLSGIAEESQFRKVLHGIRGSFPVMLASEDDHLRAAQIANEAAASGIAASAPDTLIASQAIGSGGELLTLDPDFQHLAEVVDLKLLFLGRPARPDRGP